MDHVRFQVAHQGEALPQVGRVSVLEHDRLPRASAREDRVARKQICFSMRRLEAKARASGGVTWTWYHLDIAWMNIARLEGDVDRTELADDLFSELVADKLRAEHEAASGLARIKEMPMVMVLGSAEQDVACLPHQIGVHH